MDAADVVKRADEAGLRLVRFLWCGNDGTVRAKASARHGLEGRLGAGIGLTVAMQAMNGLDQLQPVEGMGPVGEIRLVPDLDTFRVLPYAPHTGAVLTDHVRARRRAGAGVPALVPQAHGGPSRRARGPSAGRVRERVLARRHEDDGAYVPIDSGLCFSTIGMTAAQDYADDLVAALDAQGIPLEQYYAELGHGQQEISTAHAARGCGRPTSSSSCARRSAASPPARPGRVARAEAVARQRRQRRPHPLLALGPGRAQPLPRPRRADRLSAEAPLVRRRRARAPARAVRPDGAELQLVPPDRPAVLGGRVRLLGPRQPRGAGARPLAVRRGGGGLDERSS